jgi:hypothetical protein
MANRLHVPILRPEDVIPHLGRGIFHWRDGRSAKELTKAWWKARGIPQNVRLSLENAQEWKEFEIVEGFFERKTHLGTPGTPSQTDLLLLTRGQPGKGSSLSRAKPTSPLAR